MKILTKFEHKKGAGRIQAPIFLHNQGNQGALVALFLPYVRIHQREKGMAIMLALDTEYHEHSSPCKVG